jgi:hypothetical protein
LREDALFGTALQAAGAGALFGRRQHSVPILILLAIVIAIRFGFQIKINSTAATIEVGAKHLARWFLSYWSLNARIRCYSADRRHE